MNGLLVDFSRTSRPLFLRRGQLKIQQMAFVLLAFMLLFGLVMMFYVSIRLSGARGEVDTLRHQTAQEQARRLASSPEFAWTVEDCGSCIDLDKVFVLKNQSSVYATLWGNNLNVLRIQTVFPVPAREVECTTFNYPACTRITLVDRGSGYSSVDSFVALCRLEGNPVTKRCTLGKIILGVDTP